MKRSKGVCTSVSWVVNKVVFHELEENWRRIEGGETEGVGVVGIAGVVRVIGVVGGDYKWRLNGSVI